MGPPSMAETPEKSKINPKAFVRFSRPSSSTSKMERSEAKQAAQRMKLVFKKKLNERKERV